MPEFFGQSFGDFGQRMKGLLDTENPQNLTGLTANPFFTTGMGVLAANQDPNQNVFQGALTGLSAAKGQMQSDKDRDRMQKLRDELAKLIGQQPASQGAPGMPPGGQPGGPPGNPPGMMPGDPPPISRQSQFPGMTPRTIDPITDQIMRRMRWQDITGAR